MTSTDIIPKSNTGLDDLALRIKSAHRDIHDAAKKIVQRAVDAGLALNEARSKIAYGDWLPWLKDNCGLSERTAYNYMLIANNRTKFAIDANLTLTQALRQLKDSDPKDGGPASRLYEVADEFMPNLSNLLIPFFLRDARRR